MMPTFELAEFTVREGEEAALVAERPEMINALRRAFPAALAAWLTKQDDGSWLDVILWRSREAAEDAARRVNDLPEALSWFRHIAETTRPSPRRRRPRATFRSRVLGHVFTRRRRDPVASRCTTSSCLSGTRTRTAREA